MPRCLSLVCLLTALVVPAYGVPLDDAIDAYVKRDYARALTLLKPLAEAGDSTAQYRLGSMQVLGQGATADYRSGVRWLRAAATQRHRMAALDLGNMYISGLGVERDEKEAVKWFDLAAAIAAEQKTDDDCL